MSRSYEQTGRTRQKGRTRSALIAAARELIVAGGLVPTVEAAATAAGVSRTTAYRYFASQQALLIAAHPEVETKSMLLAGAPADVAARVELVVRRFLAMVVDTEAQQRTMLRLSLTDRTGVTELPLRQGRAIAWISEALEPWRGRVGDEGIRRLAVAVRAVCGIESLVWLTDVAGLDTQAAVEQMVWSARAVVSQAEREVDEPGARGAGH